jgi:hypothetical protein
VDTPSKLLVTDQTTVLTTGSAPTHGAPSGEKMVSSESNKVIAVLTALLMVAPQTSELSQKLLYFKQTDFIKRIFFSFSSY